MFTLLKKRFGASLCMRVIFALLYGFVTLTASLHHTCYPAKEEPHSCRLEDPSCRSIEGCWGETPLKTGVDQHNSNDKLLSCKRYCQACLFSLTSKPSKLCSTASLVSIEAIVKNRVISCLYLAKQFDLISSAPLRAPPIITS